MDDQLQQADVMDADTNPDTEITLVRLFDAPRDLVWRAWTDPEVLRQWWGPKGFTNPVCEIDVQRGGKIRIHMRAPDGTIYPMTGEFREVDAPRRLVFSDAALDADGNVLLEGFTIVTFEDEGGKTKLTIESIAKAIVPQAADMLQGMENGWAESLDRLADLVTHAAPAVSHARTSRRG
jgi:uncharacterized protein YndB with AHSA1/START domain